MYIDNACMQIVKAPSHFDVIVTENMFGDILSDTASVLPGSLGMCPSASFGDNEKQLHLYEPSGGSAPDLEGTAQANPIAQILSVAMMLRYSFGMETEAQLIERATEHVLSEVTPHCNCCRIGDPCALLSTACPLPTAIPHPSTNPNPSPNSNPSPNPNPTSIPQGLRTIDLADEGAPVAKTHEMGDAIVAAMHLLHGQQ